MERKQIEHRVEIKKMGDKVGKWARQEKERSDSVGKNKEEMQRRKREMLGRDSREGEMGETEVFKKSNKIRSSEGSGGVKEMLGELSRQLREELMGVRREIREVAEAQRETMKLEIERMKEELRDREAGWRKEKLEMNERMERLERELESLRIRGEERGKGKVKGEEVRRGD